MDIKQLFRHWTYSVFAPSALLREKYNAFKSLLKYDNYALELIADFEEISYGNELVDWTRIVWMYTRLSSAVRSMVEQLNQMNPSRHLDIHDYFKKIDFYVRMGLDLPTPDPSPPYIVSLSEADAHSELTGGKAANIARVARLPGFDVPPGFVVTVKAFHFFIESNELRPALDRLLRQVQLRDPDSLAEISRSLQELVLHARVPDNLVQDIEKSIGSMIGVQGQDVPRLAIRSSALAEDSELSFAGQYSSELSVPPYEVVNAYKRVLASKYSEKALTYRIRNGLSDQETPMAVLFMPMIRAKAAGVVYTRDTDESGEQAAAVYAVPGQGALLVDGSLRPEVHFYSPENPPVARSSDAGIILPPAMAAELVKKSLTLEKYFEHPQDIEWALDVRGTLFFLQSRPLQLEMGGKQEGGEEPEVPAAPILSGGECASPGIAAGEVMHVQSVMEVGSIPKDCILVVQTLTPALARLAGSISGVVARSGSRASHFASVAREYRLPVVVGFEDPFSALTEGSTVTLFADRGLVYPGEQLQLLEFGREFKSRPTTRVDQRLDKIMPYITSLTLTDPEAPTFAPEHCKSLHDFIRYAHEKSVNEMFSLVGKGGRGLAHAKQLKSQLPIVMYILDLGDGLFSNAADKDKVTPDDIQSLPMWSFWFGLSSEDVPWDRSLLHVDWEAMDRMAAGIFRHDSKLLASYAVLSKDYLHMMIRFGYHFSVLDTLCTPDANSNYIKLRFKGGGGAYDQRLLRIELIRRVLEHFGFSVDIRGDMLDASLSREGENEIQKHLASLGYLLARTRLMDMGLYHEDQVQELVKEFIQREQRFES